MAQSIGEMYLTCGWLEAILYGINCMLFGLYLRIFAISTTLSSSVLAAAILQFSLSTAHVIIAFIELLQAFAPGGNPDVYYTDPGTLSVVGFYIYVMNAYVQEFLLIWRLYGLWGRKWKVCVVPLLLFTAHVGVSTTAVAGFIPSTVIGRSHQVVHLGLTGWALEAATNITATFGIAYRLWKAHRTTIVLGDQRRLDYRGFLFLVLECGALITTSTIIMFGLFASGSQAGIAGVGIAAQISGISPLIIVVRLGIAQFSLAHKSSNTCPLEISIFRTQDVHFDKSVQAVGKSRRHSTMRDCVNSSTEDIMELESQKGYNQLADGQARSVVYAHNLAAA